MFILFLLIVQSRLGSKYQTAPLETINSLTTLTPAPFSATWAFSPLVRPTTSSHIQTFQLTLPSLSSTFSTPSRDTSAKVHATTSSTQKASYQQPPSHQLTQFSSPPHSPVDVYLTVHHTRSAASHNPTHQSTPPHSSTWDTSATIDLTMTSTESSTDQSSTSSISPFSTTASSSWLYPTIRSTKSVIWSSISGKKETIKNYKVQSLG